MCGWYTAIKKDTKEIPVRLVTGHAAKGSKERGEGDTKPNSPNSQKEKEVP
jgi:hypothetical protein